MRSLSRRLLATGVAAVLAAGVAAVPPATAGLGPAVIDNHDSFIAPRAFEVSSSAGGTVYGTDDGGFGHLYLAPAPMTTGTTMVDLGARPRTRRAATISNQRVAIPQAGAEPTTPVVEVRTCLVSACAAPTTMTVPATYQYIGNADDRAIVWNGTTHTLGLVAWTGGAPTNTYVLSEEYTDAPTAVGDATGLVVSGNGTVTYVNRTTGLISNLGYGDGGVLTPTYVAWYAVSVGETEPYTSYIYRVLRTTTEASPAPSVVRSFPDSPAFDEFAANDAGVAYTIGNDDGTNALWTMAYDGTPVQYARPLTTNSLATFESTTQFLLDDRLAGIPGFYKLTPGSYSGTLTGLVPVRGAITYSLAVSNGRAAYVDDTNPSLPLFMRSVTNGSPGPESVFSSTTDGAVALSGPYIAFAKPGATEATRQVVFGRTDGALQTRTYSASDVARIAISGRRVLLTGGARSRVIDAVTGITTDLGTVYAGIFGEYVATLDYNTGLLQRRNLNTGAVQTVRAAVPGCTTFCVDEELWQLSLWGHEVVFAFQHGGTSPATVAGLWDGNTSATSPLTMVASAGGERLYTELTYWSGLLLVAHNDATVRLYELRNANTEHLVDGFAEEPFAMDGNVVAWRPLSDLKAVVRDVRDFVPGHAPELRYLGGSVPAGFGPGLAADTWRPSFLVTQEMTGTLDIHSGSATGPVVKSISVGTLNGEIVAEWDGTDTADEDLPQGTYYWTLSTGTVSPVTVKNAAGTAPASGTVYLSQDALPAPSLTAPIRATDVSATTTFPISWTTPAGAVAGTRYIVARSTNGGSFTTLTTTTANSLSFTGSPGNTFRFKVAAIDPAGRTGAYSAVKATVVPFDDNATGTVYAGTWATGLSSSLFRGSHRYSSVAGSTYTFKATGTTIWLIGNRGTGYGQFQVSIDGGAYSGLVDAYATSTQFRKVLYTRTGLSNALHTIKVRVYGTSGRPIVGVDGVAYAR